MDGPDSSGEPGEGTLGGAGGGNNSHETSEQELRRTPPWTNHVSLIAAVQSISFMCEGHLRTGSPRSQDRLQFVRTLRREASTATRPTGTQKQKSRVVLVRRQTAKDHRQKGLVQTQKANS